MPKLSPQEFDAVAYTFFAMWCIAIPVYTAVLMLVVIWPKRNRMAGKSANQNSKLLS
jgi:hypothetical protein